MQTETEFLFFNLKYIAITTQVNIKEIKIGTFVREILA